LSRNCHNRAVVSLDATPGNNPTYTTLQEDNFIRTLHSNMKFPYSMIKIVIVAMILQKNVIYVVA
jgi:hypothetical protein